MRPATALLPPLALLCSIASGFSISPRSTASVDSAASPFHRRNIPVPRRGDQTGSRSRGLMTGRQQPQQQPQHSTSSIGSSAALSASGGAQPQSDGTIMTAGRLLTSLWGMGGFVFILLRSIRKIVPIAMEPFGSGTNVSPMNNLQLAAYVATCAWFAYVEGYKGFQNKFSPLVVSRSLTLRPSSPLHHILFAPLYSMGLFHATRKRVIVSWSVSLGVAALVAGVKRMPYPWRNIVDAGVVVGLSWGMISILVGYVLACAKGETPADPCLPNDSANKEI